MRTLALPPLPALVVSPHPDDEVLGAGGFISSLARSGLPVTVLSVTDGEAAHANWEGLGEVRSRELACALKKLAPQNIAYRRMRLADGQVSSHRSALYDTLDRLVSPSMMLVAPYECDGHPDHDAAGEVCVKIARRHAITLWRYPIWWWHHGSPERLATASAGRFPLGEKARKSKAQALSCFASQFRPQGREPIVPAHVLNYFARSYEVFLT